MTPTEVMDGLQEGEAHRILDETDDVTAFAANVTEEGVVRQVQYHRGVVVVVVEAAALTVAGVSAVHPDAQTFCHVK